MPTSDKFDQLLSKLAQRTYEGKANWRPGSRDDTYVWSGSAASVVLLTKDNDGLPPYWVRLVDADGRAIEEEIVEPGEDSFDLVTQLYVAARSDALDITSTIDQLLEDLGN
ncbi:hypothetical protein [Cryobacterium zhongshanensis]|uniref:Uncharacterized protein n=1 Tax=Cryobacterium zhongshanensis TaxID=2928153 RepID=A0AA41QX80_9MICO|nr:hypothetical protein [Cryobacterium zhongshanensis]MCI4657556.1 hypothetical protein [Cryobacterium zhongshanensis]